MAGRPRKPEGETRENVLRIRLTDEERALLDEAAAGKSLETSTWARSELVTLALELIQRRASQAPQKDTGKSDKARK
jgi:hypothetical protein